MKTKELVLASVLIAGLIAQNYLLFSFPITLTYLFIYFIGKNINSKTINILSILTFIIVKNIIYITFPTTIIMDLIGLTIIMFVSKIKICWIKYISLILSIILHILLLDLSTALLTGNIWLVFMMNVISSFSYLVYLYAPLSIIFIIIFDGIGIYSEYYFEDANEK